MLVGILFSVALLVAVANAFGAFDVRAASTGAMSLGSIADKALYLAKREGRNRLRMAA